jgi:ABC-type transport system involved in multi-copper enzyme maturation permease subunit
MTFEIARRMIGAEMLKLRRNRALLAFAGLLSIGTVVIFMGYLQIRHASNPSHYQSAGGMNGFEHLLEALGIYIGALAAVLIGSEAGSSDIASGVFRDLVATGRSRLALFWVRLPAAVLVTLAFTLTAYLLGLAGTFAFAGSQPTPSLDVILEGAGWIVLANSILAGLAVGVGSWSGSRAVTLTSVIGLQTVVTQILLNVSSLGAVRDVLPNAALGQIIPVGVHADVTMATGIAVAVLVGWAVVPATVGAWRTRVRDA